jgi:hypothetical protein
MCYMEGLLERSLAKFGNTSETSAAHIFWFNAWKGDQESLNDFPSLDVSHKTLEILKFMVL